MELFPVNHLNKKIEEIERNKSIKEIAYLIKRWSGNNLGFNYNIYSERFPTTRVGMNEELIDIECGESFILARNKIINKYKYMIHIEDF